MRVSALSILKLLAALSLLAYVFYSSGLLTEMGRKKFIDELANANFYWFALAILYIPLIDFVSTLKWHYLAKQLSFKLNLVHLFVFYTVGRFFNLILPSNIGGDLIRVHLTAKGTKRYAQAAAVVFMERLTGVITLLFLALIAFFFSLGHSGPSWLKIAFVVSIIGLITLCWLVFHPRLLNAIAVSLGNKFALLDKIFMKASKLQHEIQFFTKKPLTLVNAFVYSVIFYLFAIGNVWVSIRVFQPEVEIIALIYAVPIIMFIMNIPLSVGGVGIMEFGYVFVLGAFGLTPEVALSTALLMRFKSILAAGFGAAIYPLASSWGASIHEMETLQAPTGANYGQHSKNTSTPS